MEKCPECGSTEIRNIIEDGKPDYDKCENCGTEFEAVDDIQAKKALKAHMYPLSNHGWIIMIIGAIIYLIASFYSFSYDPSRYDPSAPDTEWLISIVIFSGVMVFMFGCILQALNFLNQFKYR